jgi:hypothetical protein
MYKNHMHKAVFGYGIKVDTLLLIGRHNDIEMGKPKNFFDEKRFPALEVRVSAVSPFLGESYVILLKSTIVETSNYDAVSFDDPKDTAGYLEGMEQLKEWTELMECQVGIAPSMNLLLGLPTRH